MATIRIEAVYLLEIYHPADASQPYVTTEPRYISAVAAETDLIAINASAANNSSDPVILDA